MRSLIGFTIICLVTIIVQTLADSSLSANEAPSVNVVNTRLASCHLGDVWSKFEQLITGAVYTLADVIIYLEGSAYQTKECAESGFKAFWCCSYDVWAEAVVVVRETVQSYYSTAQDLVSDIVQDMLVCVDL